MVDSISDELWRIFFSSYNFSKKQLLAGVAGKYTLYAMFSVVGNYDTNKQCAVVEIAINKRKNVQTFEVKDFSLKTLL